MTDTFTDASVNEHVGRRIRRRRRLMGLTQAQLALKLGVRFQQIQKYECGANRVSAGRLWLIAQSLETPVSYFYQDLGPTGVKEDDVTRSAQQLLAGFAKLSPTTQGRLVSLVESLTE